MIDKNEIERILYGCIQDNVICHQFELRPTVIAPDIKHIANVVEDYGYIIIGASLSRENYVIEGISRDMNLQAVIDKALEALTVKPEIETCSMIVNGKNIYVVKVWRIDEGTALVSDRLNDPSIAEFITRLYNICIKLQGNAKYIEASEDERNDYIRDMLDREDYVIKDQTRRGLSSTGVSSGEIDILVEKDNYPFAVIEALILKYMDKDYLRKHLDKIYTYDTTGNTFNVCLVYAEVKEFSSFWDKYCNFVKNYKFQYPILGFDESINEEYMGSEIKIMTTTHNRSGNQTKLYHICVKILSK